MFLDFDKIEFLKLSLNKDQEPVHVYSGAFNRKVLTGFRTKVLKFTHKFKQSQRKVFYIFIELAQNVGYYSLEKDKEDKGKGALMLGEDENSFFFTIGNMIDNNSLKVLEKKCEIINSLDRENLRELKRKQRNLIPGTNGGAHIGLIMVALTSQKKLNIRTEKINDEVSFFSIKVEIDKM